MKEPQSKEYAQRIGMGEKGEKVQWISLHNQISPNILFFIVSILAMS